MSLAAGDTQGRSLLLGQPIKVTITGHMQPTVVLGMPPMHLDCVFCLSGGGTPVNLTSFPTTYHSQYQTEQTQSDQSSTPYDELFFLHDETAEEKLKAGLPDTGQISADLKQTAQQTHQNTVSKKFNTYISQTFDVSTTTGFDDHVSFSFDQFNLYIYPVIGSLACPQGQSTCADAEKLPLNVQFSGPDMVVLEDADGAVQEWYQPLHEPGNVFSYPWNQAQLEALYSGFSPLITLPAERWFTDGSGRDLSVTWSVSTGSDVTSSSVSTHSFDTSNSVSAKANLTALVKASLSLSFDYNNSDSTSAQNETITTVGSSTGVKVFKPSFEDPSKYEYAVETYLFGQSLPKGSVDKVPLSTDVMATGPLFVGFVADPTDQAAGFWWQQTYSVPDVALNHPTRWGWTVPSAVTDPDIFTFNAADPTNPADSEFYYMKGFFITPADATGQGPQRTQATAGDQLLLQARVYNYSLTDVPQGTTVHVRFYGQGWDNTQGDFTGLPIVIGESKLNPIPGFNSASSAGATPNWALASTTFDTTNYSDTYLIFWVVVWMEDPTGDLGPEMVGHGLQAKPGALTSPTDVAIEPYSNNVGFYKQPFFVASQEAQSARSASAAPTKPVSRHRRKPFIVKRVSISPGRVNVNEKVKVSVKLRTGNTPLDGTLVIFYDGDPKKGGKAFDVEHIPHLRAHDTYITKAKFTPRTCGVHKVFVVVGAGTPDADTGKAVIRVRPEEGRCNHVDDRHRAVVSDVDGNTPASAAQHGRGR